MSSTGRNRSSCILVTDEQLTPEQEVLEHARLLEQEQRAQTMAKFILGHAVWVVNDCDPLNIRVRVGEHFFACPREQYPTVEMVAHVSLAVFAGEQHANDAFDIGDIEPQTARDMNIPWASSPGSLGYAAWEAEQAAEGTLREMRREAEKRYRRGNLAKGLRP